VADVGRCQCGCVARHRRERAARAFDCGWTMTKADYDRLLRSVLRPSVPTRRALRERLCVEIERRGPIATADLADAMDTTTSNIARVLRDLKDRGQLQRDGHGKASRWRVSTVVPFLVSA